MDRKFRSSSHEGYDLIIGLGWQAADSFGTLADANPDIKYAVIDTVCSNDAVTSIGFKEWEGAYVLGTMMATAFPEENKFGYICSYQTQATYKYRYGYSEGVLSVNPDAEFMYIIQIPMQIPHLHMNMRFSSRQQDARSLWAVLHQVLMRGSIRLL